MADDDGGLELNLVSQPVTSARPAASRKKRGSGKAWDKKKRGQPKPSMTTTRSDSSTQQASPKQSQQQQRGAGTGTGGGEALSHEKGTVKAARSPAAVVSPAAAATATTESSSAAGNAAACLAAPPAHSGSGGSSRKSSSSTIPKAKAAAKPGTHDSKEPSTERRRVLEMAGRSTAPRTPAPAPARSGGGGGGGEGSSARASKRKRPAAGGGGTGSSSGPVASGGVVDFTIGDATAPSKKKKKKEDKSRKAAATAAAVAKATAAMEKSGAKWWDDDDDDHVVAAKSKRQISTSYYAPGGGFGGWKPGAAGEEQDEQVEDKDGGLPSKIHPNSVRTKAVDMDEEASKAMGILEALLGKGGDGGSSGPREESRLIKNGGKSKKKAKQEPLERVGDKPAVGREADDGTALAGSEPAAPQLPMDADITETDAEIGEPATDGGPANASNGVAGDAADASTADAAAGGSGGGARGGAERSVGGVGGGGVPLASRKNRARIANAAAAAADAAAGGASTTAPLPEHHARPRELSRRAAVRPLASTRSGHVMAAGPGATFSALNLPPKMVSHLEEPKGDLGGGGMGLAGPTVCQLAAVPILAAGNNAVIKSETGSGKTLAYLLPMLCDLAAMEPRVDREKGTLAVVLAPTRELGSQILEVCVRARGGGGRGDARRFLWRSVLRKSNHRILVFFRAR